MATDFIKNYEIEIIYETASGKTYHFPPTQIDGVMVKVTPQETSPWAGIFASGNFTGGISGSFAMPDPNQFCFITKGIGYIVNSNDPDQWYKINLVPIMSVNSIGDLGIILFSNYTEIEAYDAKGLKWRTGRLSFDGFKIKEISNNILTGLYWDIRNDAESAFYVNLSDGSVSGVIL